MSFKDIIKITFNLFIIYVAGGLLLAYIYSKASPIIYKNNEKAKQQALKELMPEADIIERLGEWYPYEKHAEYYIGKKSGSPVGYVVQSFGKGYSSYINVLFSVGLDFKVKKINVLHHTETPGLGDEIETDAFKAQFKDKDEEHLEVVKIEKEGYIQAITGATISSRGVSENAVRAGLKFLKDTLTKGGNDDNEQRSSQH
ncbi:electron transport complex, RnfABCDGE type, G subunit [Candidatus Magnetoovum chiemensis]|nr:electron transport complex, RnfABCDGE type, G subunit [Candidatus Magnetoovum chiemensis]